MPPKSTPTCVECKKTETLLWRTVETGQICQECFELSKEKQDEMQTEIADDKTSKKGVKDKEQNKEEQKDKKETAAALSMAEDKCSRLRKSTRATRFKSKVTANPSSTGNGSSSEKNSTTSNNSKVQTKGRNRRSLFKRTPLKTPLAQATTHTVESVFHKGSYLQIGDIVSLVDGEDNVYYAQIRGLLIDNYCEKSAFLTWLIPTQESLDPKEGFDPATYLIGPDEELSRKLSCLEFIMHAPSNYYLDRTTPFPLPDSMEYDTKPGGYIWTTLPEYHRNKPIEV